MKTNDSEILDMIRKEVDELLNDGALSTESFEEFCDDYDVYHAYTEDYEDGQHKEYLTIVYDEIEK